MDEQKFYENKEKNYYGTDKNPDSAFVESITPTQSTSGVSIDLNAEIVTLNPFLNSDEEFYKKNPGATVTPLPEMLMGSILPQIETIDSNTTNLQERIENLKTNNQILLNTVEKLKEEIKNLNDRVVNPKGSINSQIEVLNDAVSALMNRSHNSVDESNIPINAAQELFFNKRLLQASQSPDWT
jgi:endonuclease III-like uncharacterized protein